MLLAVPGLFAAALVGIQIQNFRVRSWKQVPGRITLSQSSGRTVYKDVHSVDTGQHHSTDFVTTETAETRNFISLVYEYAVDGATYHGTQIDLGTDPGNFNIPEVLARYPEGKAVTVFYNPARPDKCILERDDPKNLRNGWLGVFVMAALSVGGVLFFDRANDLLQEIVAVPKRTPLVLALGLFAAVLALFAHMFGRAGREMKGWPKTEGKIVQSSVEALTVTHARPNARPITRINYVPRVVYQYDLAGTSFRGDDIGMQHQSEDQAVPAKQVAGFPINSGVVVFYDPQNPAHSTLLPNVGYMPSILGVASALFLTASAIIAFVAR